VYTQLAAPNIDTFLAGGSKCSAGEAEYSGKRDNCAAFSSDYRAKVSQVHKN